MDAKLKAEWVKALRSGEYTQTKQALKDSSGHCCLGVLCEVALKTAGIDERLISVGREQIIVYTTDAEGDVVIFAGESGELTASVREVLGLTDADECDLISRNDGLSDFRDNPQTFAQIADFIEAEVA